MSRQPSPGPSNMHAAPTGGATTIVISNAQSAGAGGGQKAKAKPYVGGITAGVEDMKYHAKYKELKRKVKEIEVDNDRLYFKLLLSKKNIRRLNLERAILYERLAAVPPTPGRRTNELPPETDPLFTGQHPPAPDQAQGQGQGAHAVDPADHALAEYLRAHPRARVQEGPDGRVVAVEDVHPAVHPCPCP